MHPWVGLQPGQGAQRVAGVRNGPAAASDHHAGGGRRVAGARWFRRVRGGRSSPQRVGHGAIAAGLQADAGQSGSQSGQASADPFWGRRGWPGVCPRLVCVVVAWRIPCGRAAGLSKREGGKKGGWCCHRPPNSVRLIRRSEFHLDTAVEEAAGVGEDCIPAGAQQVQWWQLVEDVVHTYVGRNTFVHLGRQTHVRISDGRVID